MAINPNFVFADPALQAQVVNMAQVQAQADAARQQQFAATLSEMRRQRTEQADKEERRGIREADIRRLDAQEAERRRQFDASLGFSEKGLASTEKIEAGRLTGSTTLATEREKAQARAEAYNELRRRLTAQDYLGDQIHTPTELEAEVGAFDFTPQQKELLRGIHKSALGRAAQLATESDRAAQTWQAKIAAIDQNPKVKQAEKDLRIDSILTEFNKSPQRDYTQFDPTARTFIPRFRKPRLDVVLGPEPAPQSASRLPGTGELIPATQPNPYLEGGAVRDFLRAKARENIPSARPYESVRRSLGIGSPTVPVVPTMPQLTNPLPNYLDLEEFRQYGLYP